MLPDYFFEAAQAANPSAKVGITGSDDDSKITVSWVWSGGYGAILCLHREIIYLDIPNYELIFDECKSEMNSTK